MKNEFMYIQEKEIIDKFFDECLSNQLYQPIEERHPDFKSRMKAVFERKETTAIAVTLSYDHHKNINGIALLEFEPKNFPMKKIIDNSRCKNGYKVIKDYEKEMTSLGFLSIYVKKENRQQGIASSMVKTLYEETLKIDDFQNPFIECTEKAYELLSKLHIDCVNMKRHQGNFKYAISDLAEKIIERENNFKNHIDKRFFI